LKAGEDLLVLDHVAGEQIFGAMDPSETPRIRASVDMCEIKLELTPS
jgi:hypothetical protein